MIKNCQECQKKFEITEDDLKFYKQISPSFKDKKYLIPPPTHCPNCRQQRRLAACNELNLYPSFCGLCKKRTLTEHSPTYKQKIICPDCWYSDNWDPLDYGQDFDFSRPFFEQIEELKRKTPFEALVKNGLNENSDYIHYAGECKNCYLIMHADFCENCYYGYGIKKSTSCVDGFYNLKSELCYDCVYCYDSYGLKSCQDCMNCSSSAFLRDCIGCKNCYLCTGLREKEYCFENKQLTKKEYEEKISKINLGSYKEYQKNKTRLKELEKNHTFKEYTGYNLENCLGNYLINCKNVKFSFDCEEVEDAKYCYQVVRGSKNIYDIYQYGSELQESYECSIAGSNSYHLAFTRCGTRESSDIFYCSDVTTSKNCFGCVSMHHKKYCILNKQYSREEYEELVPKIIEHMKQTGEWGEFFPIKNSFFGYNNTTAQLYYPLTKEEAEGKGYKWDDYETPDPDILKTIEAKDLPDDIKDVNDDILNIAIKCEETGKLYKIIPQELKFYRKNNIPLPRKNFYQRHLDRFNLRNPRKFFKRECSKCEKEIITTYSKNKAEIVYCEDCYMKEVY